MICSLIPSDFSKRHFDEEIFHCPSTRNRNKDIRMNYKRHSNLNDI